MMARVRQTSTLVQKTGIGVRFGRAGCPLSATSASCRSACRRINVVMSASGRRASLHRRCDLLTGAMAALAITSNGPVSISSVDVGDVEHLWRALARSVELSGPRRGQRTLHLLLDHFRSATDVDEARPPGEDGDSRSRRHSSSAT